jgi:hypothetical protein
MSQTQHIFKKYFRTKLIVSLAAFFIATIGRYFNTTYGWDWALTAGMFAFIIFIASFLGFIDYNFYEKIAPKEILKFIGRSPLIEFQNIGFVQKHDEVDKLEGHINGFEIFLSPMVKMGGETYLIIFIPLTIQEGFEEYFKRFDEFFNFTLKGEMLMSQAVIKNYQKTYDFDRLFDVIKNTTNLLIERNIHPIEIIED